MGKEEGYVLQQMPGVFVSKTKIILAAVAFVVLIIIIIILAAVLGHQNAKEGATAGNEGAKTTIGPTAVVPTTAGTEAWWNVRLPKNVIPDHYDILLRIDLKKLRFDGSVSILVNVTQSTDLILVHTNKMNVTTVGVTTKDGDSLKVKNHFWFEKNQFYVLMMDSTLRKGQQYVVKMEFEAFLANDLKGLYKSSYKNKAGETVYLAATQFQPTDARRAFPCFDEPALKATFTVTLAHDPKLISVSNMPVVETKEKDGWQYDHFNQTVVMPTYLLAFLVCDFGSKTTETATGIKMTYYATKDQVDQLDYAAETGKAMMEYMEKHFGIPFPLPKCDMAAVPDFAAGAMENWGLILYRETALLYKPNVSSETNKQRVAAIISHELAHMWFGNLVTMKWWDDLWLNEGFASFVEYLGVNHVHPEWEMMNYFVTADLVFAFSLDGLRSSHPIKVNVSHPDEISEIFDSISYNKGASIIRMLRYFLGESVFDRGLTRYLKKYQYSNAETDDLWRELHEESCDQGKCVDVKQMMDTWTLQMNYPVLMVKKEGGSYEVTQDRFLFDSEANVTSKYESPFDYKWVVPFTYITKNSPDEEKSLVLNKSSASFSDDGSTWVKGNVGQTGLYRVNYEDSNWEALRDQLTTNHQVFNISDRAALIDDAFDLARGERINYTKALDMTSYLKNETKYIPWDAATSGLYTIRSYLPKTSTVYENMQTYLKFQSKKLYQNLGFTDTGDHLKVYLRSTILSINCGSGDEDCLNKAADFFKKWMEDPDENPVPANFRSLVYFYGIQSGGEKEWDFAFEQFTNTTVASERRKLLYALSATQVPWLLSRYLNYVLDESKIKGQDGTTVISYVANYNKGNGRQMAWDFVRLNWDTLRQRYGGGFFAFRNLIYSVTSGFANDYRLQEVLAFKEAHKDLGTGARAMDQAIERIKAKIQWRKKNEVTIDQWLKKFIADNIKP